MSRGGTPTASGRGGMACLAIPGDRSQKKMTTRYAVYFTRRYTRGQLKGLTPGSSLVFPTLEGAKRWVKNVETNSKLDYVLEDARFGEIAGIELPEGVRAFEWERMVARAIEGPQPGCSSVEKFHRIHGRQAPGAVVPTGIKGPLSPFLSYLSCPFGQRCERSPLHISGSLIYFPSAG